MFAAIVILDILENICIMTSYIQENGKVTAKIYMSYGELDLMTSVSEIEDTAGYA